MGVMDALCRNVVWPLWSRRDDPNYPRFVRYVERGQFDSEHVVRARQNVRLRRLIHHAVACSPYYRQQFQRLGLSTDAIRTSSDLDQVPVLTKQCLRSNAEKLRSESFLKPSLVTKTTSGSTGVPLRVLLDRPGLAWKRATTLNADEWSGWRRGSRVARAWGNPEYRHFGPKGWLRNRLLERAIHLDTLKMDQTDLERFSDRLSRFRPKLIFGHAHSVYLLAQFLRDRDRVPPQPDGIITTAMVLHDFQRRLIEQVFGCRVTNRYGCEEVSLIACECPEHQGLHVNIESVVVEILKDGRPAPAGIPGHVVVTDLANYAMPLIRYQVGDMAIWADGVCRCGRAAPRLARIEGREADYVVTSSGHFISGISLTENFATQVPGVLQLQIVQERVDYFRFRIVRGRDFSEAQLAQLVRERFGPAAQYVCEFVPTIASEASGKYRFCISHLAQAHRGQAA